MTHRRASKVDANQRDIVAALRKVGAVVRFLSQGDGLPDLLVGYRAQTFLLEVKNKEGRNRITPAQEDFNDRWVGGSLHIVHDAEEAIKQITRQ